MKCYKNIFLLTIFVLFLKNVFLQSSLFDLEKDTKSISIEERIIYIINQENNNTLNIYGQGSNKIYNDAIKRNKEILKIDNSNLIIIGLSTSNNLCYQKCEIDKNYNINIENLKCSNIIFNTPSKMEARYIEEDMLIISALESNNFFSCLINLNDDSQSTKMMIALLPNGAYPEFADIKCDSFDGDIFYCIYYYQLTGFWKMNYSYGNFVSKESHIKSICYDKCSYGNVMKVSNDKDYYLICYFEILVNSNNIYGIICQYYYFEKGEINFKPNFDFLKDSIQIIAKPLNLYSFENTLLIQFCELATRISPRIIIFSPDFKLSIHPHIYSPQLPDFNFVNLFISLSSIKLIFEEGPNTNIFEYTFLQNDNDTELILSHSNNYFEEINFKYKNTIKFTLDENINLLKDNEIIGMNGLLDLANEGKYYFRKKNSVGVFYYYFSYVSTYNSGIYYFFSLIRKITVTICYDLCNECIPKKEGNAIYSFCISCIGGYYQIFSEVNNLLGANCYNTSDPKIENYYLNNGFYYPCHDSCKNCTDNKSCLSCKSDYYFQVFNKGSIISNICHNEIEVNQKFYLDNNANIFHNNLIHQKAFRECYSHCLTCKEGGDEINNNCSTCDKGFETYPFSKQQCLINKTNCTNINKCWAFINNNISCIDFNNCNEFIIIGGSNNGQCVSICQNFNNPYEETVFLTLNVTGNCKYCISFDECLKNKFEIDPYSKTCESHLNCEDIDIFSDEQFIIRNGTEIINTTDEISPGGEGYIKYEILTKIVLKENENYSKFHIRDKTLLENYVKLHQANLKNDTRIYLIYTEKYKNFTIKIYIHWA